ncbi:MAG TPA: MYXO-CTERM sorting domain-containing protein [Polyangiaceae bacterium]|nr:MYXO-CTERM sorting domain-containing protein [Polyangiaceae bacterium]
MSERRTLSRRPLLAVLAAGAALPVLARAPAAAAKGKGAVVTVNTKQIAESSGGWKVMLTIKLPQKPTIPHQTFRFMFSPLAIYETYIDDSGPGEKTRSIPQGKDVQPNVETMDVGFSDARGELYDTTKFDFTIRRDRNFFAGEYRLEVLDADGNPMGQPVNLKLEGKNEVVNRRTMMLEGNSGAKKPPAAAAPASADPKPAAAAAGPAPLEGAVPKPEDMGSEPPPPVEKKGGCGCAVPGSSETPRPLLALLAGAGALAFGRARRAAVRRPPAS